MRNRSVLVASLLLIALLAGCAPPAPTVPTMTPSLTLEPTWTRLPSITPAPTDTPTPTPAPAPPPGTTDTGQILYSDWGGQLFSYDRKGQTHTLLASDTFQWSLAPDGRKALVQVTSRDGDKSLMIDLVSGNWAQMISPTGWQMWASWPPGWSPNGASLVTPVDLNGRMTNALLSAEDGGVLVPVDFGGWTYAISGAGELLTSRVENRRVEIARTVLGMQAGQIIGADSLSDDTRWLRPEVREGWAALSMAISPDGQKLAFIAAPIEPSQTPTGRGDLYVINLDGSGLVDITRGELTRDQRELAMRLAWSPDSRRIAFNTVEVNRLGTYVDARLFVAMADGSDIWPIAEDDMPLGAALMPSWSPDGSELLYVAGKQAWVSRPDGSEQQVLPIGKEIWMAAFRPPLADGARGVNCAARWTQLQIGDTAVVLPGLANRVRSVPAKGDNGIDMIQPGTTMTIVAGPVCTEGLVFWQIQTDEIPGGLGWTAEGDGTEYYLQPVGR
jgi:hypothetical protein